MSGWRNDRDTAEAERETRRRMTMSSPRFYKGVYRNCRFCSGRGCLACSGEADRDYKREFPNGPEPIAIIKATDPGLRDTLSSLLSGQSGVNAGDAGLQDAVNWIVNKMQPAERDE